MNVCIIGGNGFIGTELGIKSKMLGYNVSVFGRTSPVFYTPNSFEITDFNDLTNLVRSLLDSDLIFYCAAAGVQSNAKDTSSDIYKLNTSVPIELFNKLKENNYKGVFVSFGSYFEIGNNCISKSFSEEDVLFSQLLVPNNYCISKRLLSRFFSSIQAKGFYHFILPTIYGPRESKHRLIPYLLESIASGKQIQLSDGDQVRQYLFVDDFTETVFSVLGKKAEFGIYNFPSAETLSVKELVKIVFSSCKKEMSNCLFGQLEKPDSFMKHLELNANKLCGLNVISVNKKIEASLIEY